MTDFVEIDELGEDDSSLQEFAALCVELDPLADGTSVEDLRRWGRMVGGEYFRVGARRAGRLIAAGAIYPQPYDPDSHLLPCQLLVPADLRDSGLADAVLARLSAWARDRHEVPVISVGISKTDPALVAYWNARGLSEVNRYVELELLLAEVAVGAPASDTAIVSLLDRPELLVPAWELVRDTWRDMPGDAGTPPPLDQWRAHFDEGRRPFGGTLLALDGDDLVGVTITGADAGDLDHAWTSFTGVRQQARGRGIATALKLRQVEFCRAAGYRRLTTGNHLGNAPMLAINERLGFRESKVVLQLQGAAPEL